MSEIRLPQFGMGMSDGTIIGWMKAEGEMVRKGEPLCEIEAAKTTVEMDAPESGILARILVQVGDNVPVNTVICEIADSGETAVADDAGTGDSVARSESDALLDDRLAALREEADIPAAAPDGQRASPLARRCAEGNGVDLAAVKGSGPNGKVLKADVLNHAAPKPEVQVEPRARRRARELDVDLASVAGTGPNGRIVAEDIDAHANRARPEISAMTSQTAPSAPAPAPAAAAQPAPVVPVSPQAQASGSREVTHSMMRRTIAKRLTESKQTVPHFYVRASCQIDALLALRGQINQDSDIKVSVNDLIVRAVALALGEVPEANVSWGEKAMLHHDVVDVAVAVATPRGLVTPIVRDVASKTIRQVSAEIKELAGRGKEGKLKPEEYQGGCTSVSNLGMFGVEEFSAILNPPQSSIFAIGAGEERLIARNGAPVVATMMNVTVSVDHRAVDGAIAAQLLAAFKRLIETPARILA